MRHRDNRPTIESNWPASCYIPRHRAETANVHALSARLAESYASHVDAQVDQALDELDHDFTLTKPGLMALFPRGECGHIVCKPLDACCLIRTAGDPGPGQPQVRRRG